jgi:hypothetical protein
LESPPPGMAIRLNWKIRVQTLMVMRLVLIFMNYCCFWYKHFLVLCFKPEAIQPEEPGYEKPLVLVPIRRDYSI